MFICRPGGATCQSRAIRTDRFFVCLISRHHRVYLCYLLQVSRNGWRRGRCCLCKRGGRLLGHRMSRAARQLVENSWDDVRCETSSRCDHNGPLRQYLVARRCDFRSPARFMIAWPSTFAVVTDRVCCDLRSPALFLIAWPSTFVVVTDRVCAIYDRPRDL